MKNNLYFLLFCFLVFSFGCNQKQKEAKDFSYLHSLVDSLSLNKGKNIFIYSINPNDCINCLYGVSQINKNLAEMSNAKIYVLFVERSIEKNELIKTSKGINLNDSINKVVLWDKNIFQKVNSLAKQNNSVAISILSIYNYSLDSIVYCKPIKEIMAVEELAKYINN